MAMTSASFMAEGGFGSALLTKLDKIDCSQILSAVLTADRELLGHIKEGPAADNIEVNWIEDELVGCTFEGNTTTSATLHPSTFSGSASLERMIASNALIKPINGTWYARVTSNTGASIISITLLNSTTHVSTAGAGVSTETFVVVGTPYADLDSASNDKSQSRSKRRNFTQVFEKAVQITQSRKGMSMEAVVDELQHQIKLRTLEMKRDLDISVINSIAYYDGSYLTATTEWRQMQGIINYIRDYDMDHTNNDTLVTDVSGALTISALNGLLYDIWDAGGLDEQSDPIIVVGASQQRVIAAWEKELRRVEQGERTVGYYRDIFLSDMGKELPVVLDRWMPSDMLIVLDRSRVALRALRGDAWHMEKMAKTGRNEKWQISGQYTIEVRNADKCHGLLYNLS